VKVNRNPGAKALYEGEFARVDVASIVEVDRVRALLPEAECFFMAPIA